jgi:poly-gamma-glutamate capsule biosynthesis protein CapA/YwtB (metallophosphatase superfamily)
MSETTTERGAIVVGLGGDVSIMRPTATDPLKVLGLDEIAFSFLNLECPITDAGDEVRHERTWDAASGHVMRPAAVADLRALTAVSIANNHSLDYGLEGYRSTMRVLDAAGVRYAGGGDDRESARAPIVTAKDGLTVAFLAYTCLYGDTWPATATRPGMATIRVHTSYEPPLRVFEQPGMPPIVRTHVDPSSGEEVAAEIARAKAQADLLVVSIHWGISKGHRAVMDYQRELGRLCVDAGADAIFGHHSHVLGPIELYRGQPICYSLGDLFFERDKPAWSETTAWVRLYVEERRIVRLGAVPLTWTADSGYDPVHAPDALARRAAEELFPGEGEAVGGYEWIDGEAVVAIGVG